MSSDRGSGIDRGESLFESFSSAVNKPQSPAGSSGNAPPPAPPAAPVEPVLTKFVWCSDCRSAIRTHYFALDTRPLCGKCRVGYSQAIDFARGSAGLRRALTVGGGAALACAAGLGIILMILPVFRIFLAIGIGHVVGKAINKATGDYTMRRYQVMAALLTYFAIGLGSLVPVVKEALSTPTAAEVRAGELDARLRADEEALAAEEAAADDEEEEGESYPGENFEEIEQDLRDARAAQLRPPVTAEESSAQSLRAAGFVKGIFFMLFLLLVLPLLSLFAFGLYGTAIGILAFGYGIYKAWDMTGSGHTYQIFGPYRVGTGPIPVTMG